MHGKVFKDGSWNFAIFKIELFATISNNGAYNQWTVFACYCSSLIIFTCKIKIGLKWPCLEGGIWYTFLFCRYVFTFFRKCQLFFVSLTFCFITKIKYKIENWYHCLFYLSEFYEQKQPSRYIRGNVVNKMQEKYLWSLK